MSMKAFEELKDMLCAELDEIARKGEMGAGDLEIVHKLTDTIKNIDKIIMLEDDGEYSQRGYSRGGDWDARGRYDDGNSYANRGQHYVRGHYSRAGRRYSRADGRESMMEHLDMMLDDAKTDKERDVIKRCKAQLENM